MRFDLLVKGGEVIDPSAGYSGQLDVAIKHNRIAAVDHQIPGEAAFHVIDASGQYVTPGLVDLHSHVYAGATYWGVQADMVASRTGVTTWLDAGSAGAMSLPGFRDFIATPAGVRIYALLNISRIGLTGPVGELADLEDCDARLCTHLVNRNRDLVLGVKARMSSQTVGANGTEPLRRAREAADQCEVPLMVHIGASPPELADVLALMKPGDVLTHGFTGATMRIVDERGHLFDFVRRARDSGVILDIGHGAGSFSFATAEAAMAAGPPPDVISSDIHQVSINGPMFDLPTCLSKFLYLGMSLPAVVRAATSRPAAVLGLQSEIGTLRPGALADVAVFTLSRGRFPLYDTLTDVREGTQLLRNTLTILNGRPLRPLPAEPPAPWIELTDFQRELIRRGHIPAVMGSPPGEVPGSTTPHQGRPRAAPAAPET